MQICKVQISNKCNNFKNLTITKLGHSFAYWLFAYLELLYSMLFPFFQIRQTLRSALPNPQQHHLRLQKKVLCYKGE